MNTDMISVDLQKVSICCITGYFLKKQNLLAGISQLLSASFFY